MSRTRSREVEERVETLRTLYRAGIEDAPTLVKVLRERALLPGNSYDADRVLVRRALEEVLSTEPEQVPAAAAPSPEQAREEYRQRLRADHEWAISLSEECRAGFHTVTKDGEHIYLKPDLPGAVAARRIAMDAAIREARICGVDTERPLRIDMDAASSLDWSALASALGFPNADALLAALAGALTPDAVVGAAEVTH